MTPITSALRRLMTAEGARVTADRDEFCGICDALDSIHARKLKALDASTARVDELCAENERLRGLATLNWEWAHSCCGNNCKMKTEECGYGIDRDCNYEREIYDRMRELGIEVAE